MPSDHPSGDCPTCHRPYPKVRSDAPGRRMVLSFSVPKGEKTVIPENLEILHQRWQPLAPTMLPPVGAMTGWKYYTLAMALGLCVVEGVAPQEEG